MEVSPPCPGRDREVHDREAQWGPEGRILAVHVQEVRDSSPLRVT